MLKILPKRGLRPPARIMTTGRNKITAPLSSDLQARSNSGSAQPISGSHFRPFFRGGNALCQIVFSSKFGEYASFSDIQCSLFERSPGVFFSVRHCLSEFYYDNYDI